MSIFHDCNHEAGHSVDLHDNGGHDFSYMLSFTWSQIMRTVRQIL